MILGFKKIFISFFVFVYLVSFSFAAFNICNVNINEPWFIVKNNAGNDILIIDNEGDMFVQGNPVTSYNSGTVSSGNAIVIGDLYFTQDEAYMKNVVQNINNVVGNNGVLLKSSSGQNVAYLDSGIELKGKAIFQDSQAGCMVDGKYCNGNNLETRDYFCDITGIKTGYCSHNVEYSENCLTKSSTETDGGNDYLNYGEVKDYSSCVGSGFGGGDYCSYNVFKDRCISSSNLLEYSAQGASVNSNTVNCDDEFKTYYCSGTNRMKVVYGCSVGKCEVTNPALFVQACNTAGTPTYTAWTCASQNPGIKTRVRTEYSNECTSGNCWVSDYDVTETVNCAGGHYCSSGNCLTITYSWSISSWSSCSAACGPGSQTRSVSCIRGYDGAVVADSYCGPKPAISQSCNLGACCIPQIFSNVCVGKRCGAWPNGCGGTHNCGGCGGSHEDCNTKFGYNSGYAGNCDQSLSGGK